jgi:hypothetical protein
MIKPFAVEDMSKLLVIKKLITSGYQNYAIDLAAIITDVRAKAVADLLIYGGHSKNKIIQSVYLKINND